MSDQITLIGISANGFHGVFPEERRDGQIFIVDLKLSLDLSSAGTNDDLTKTVDYGSVASIVAEEITGPALLLIEALAERISSRILEDFPTIEEVEVTVHKPSAPIQVKFSNISVTIRRFR